MTYIDGSGPIAAKLAAVYALRDFKEHREFIRRFCTTQHSQVVGGTAESLIKELNLTAKAVENTRKSDRHDQANQQLNGRNRRQADHNRPVPLHYRWRNTCYTGSKRRGEVEAGNKQKKGR